MNAPKRVAREAPNLISKGVSIIALEGLRPGSDAPVAVLEFHVEPDASSEVGANPVSEIIRILAGAAIVLSGIQELPVQAGDWVLIEPNVKHQVRNVGAEVLKALSFSWVVPLL